MAPERQEGSSYALDANFLNGLDRGLVESRVSELGTRDILGYSTPVRAT